MTPDTPTGRWTDVTAAVLGGEPTAADRDAADRMYVWRHARCTAQAACLPTSAAAHAEVDMRTGAWVRARAAGSDAVAPADGQHVDVITGQVDRAWLARCDDRTVGAEWRRRAHDAVMCGACFSE